MGQEGTQKRENNQGGSNGGVLFELNCDVEACDSFVNSNESPVPFEHQD